MTAGELLGWALVAVLAGCALTVLAMAHARRRLDEATSAARAWDPERARQVALHAVGPPTRRTRP